MARMVTVECEWCKKSMTVRVADRKRGWGRWCSKSCKAKAQEKHTGQHRAWQERETDDDHGHIFASGVDGHGQE